MKFKRASGILRGIEGLSPTPSPTGWPRRGRMFRSITRRRESAPHRAMTGLSDAASNHNVGDSQ